MKDYLKLIRVKHWLKNFIVFIPVFFSINLLNKKNIQLAVIAFIAFCIASSIVYILNDLNDCEKDKLHPIKKQRPIASGRVSKKIAVIITVLLCISYIAVTTVLYLINKNIFVFVIPIIYIFMNIMYSVVLKKIPIIDVGVIALGFVLRIMYGGITTNIEVSKYLYLMIIFGAFFLGFGKRRNEIQKNGTKSRKSLKYYNKSFLDKNMYVMLTLTIVSYTLWCIDKDTIKRINNDYLYWTIPLLIIILQLYSLNIEGNSHGDPIEVILCDKKIMIFSFIYFIVMTLILYII